MQTGALIKRTVTRMQRRGLAGATMFALALALAACSSGSTLDAGAGSAGATSGGASVDQFQIVDCLLPAAVRQIGTGFTYPGRRRAIRTSASDCGIRGGEYVAYDRANYATALKVWLPQAEAGDPKAQTYVGEIFEKGLGTTSDYGAAAAWYRRAAEQNYAPAQVNLGSLYERGLGVPRDPQQAVSWYRRASGLPTAGVAFVPAADPDEVARLEAERQRLEEENARQLRELQLANLKIGSLEGELETTRKRLRELKGDAEQGSRSLDAERRKLAQQESALAADRQRLSAERERLRQLEAQVRNLQSQPTPADGARLAQAEREAELARADLEKKEAEIAEKDRARAALQKDVTTKEAEISRLTDQISELNRQAQQQAGQVEKVAAKDAEVKRLNAEIAQLRRQTEQSLVQAREVAAKEAEIKRLNEEIARLNMEARRAPPEALAELPVVQLIEPKPLVVRGSKASITLRTAVEARLVVGRVIPATNVVSLTVNDVEKEPTETGVFRSQVGLTGQVTPVSIVAVDRAGRRVALDFEIARLTPQEAPPPPTSSLGIPLTGPLTSIDYGRYYALVIGNDAYQHLPPLRTAVADAQAVADLLRSRYGFANVKLLTNVTRYQIASALEEMRETLTEKDNLLIYFAGHGEIDRRNQRGHWLPVDAEVGRTANWISNIFISDVLNASSAKHILVVADSCFSGTLTRSALAQLQAGMSDDARAGAIRAMAGERVRTALTSGGEVPVVDSTGGQHSVFAQAFLDLLSKNPGVLEAQLLHRELAKRVKRATDLLGVSQVAQYAPIEFAGHGGGDFLFVVRPLVSG